ncbi:PREDICTED: TRAF3-interacting JNK-activating modulator isoform X2 [Calidris pugnax]|uniref:TRAF3-interacting JNK-activating modulator isoform X2 n=1 Tax=Calidris pugnax TaxID=198806 RepID=UPI00071CBD1E|nr:PREDICTED: TRAF3-interacting JNK-activating modulator isoform X2 [Calidris pugnax]
MLGGHRRDRRPKHVSPRSPPHGWIQDHPSCSRNPDPHKSKHRSEGLEPADRVRWCSPPSPGCEFGYPPGTSLRCPNTFHLSTNLRCTNTPTLVGQRLVPTDCSKHPPLSSVTHFLFYFSCGIAVLNKEIVQLSNYLKEALHRELLLKQKMVILQELFSTLLQASEKSWQGQLNEDKLKCKLQALENQLQACTQSYSKECVKKILIEMEDQKQTYEQKAKEALQKMLEDKLQTEQQLQNSQRSLAATREDLAFWKEHYATLKAELTKMTTTHAELENSFHDLQSQLQRVAGQKEHLQQALHSLQSEHAALHQRASALRQDNNLKAEHISAIEDKLQKEQNQKLTLEATISHLHNLIKNQTNEQKMREMMVQRKDQVSTTQTPPLTPAKEKQNALLERPEEEEGEESLKDEIQKRTSLLTAKENEVPMDIRVAEVKIPRWCSAGASVKRCRLCGSPTSLGAYKSEGILPANGPSLCLQCTELRSELEALSEEYRSCLTRLRQCRDELNHFQSEQAKRRRRHWIPLLVAAIAMAIATFLASYRP